MAGMILVSLMAAQLAAGQSASAVPGASPVKVSATARATVRILPGVRVSFGNAGQPEGPKQTSATITTEDGTRRLAKLVEFQ